MPRHARQQWQQSLAIFNKLPIETQERIHYHALCLEYFQLNKGRSACMRRAPRWLRPRHALQKSRRLAPLALRRMVYRELQTLEILPLLPHRLQKQWTKLPVQQRLEILRNIQEKSRKHLRLLLIDMLERKRPQWQQQQK